MSWRWRLMISCVVAGLTTSPLGWADSQAPATDAGPTTTTGRHTLTLAYGKSDSATAYRAGPASATVGVLLMPGADGVTPTIRGWADQLGALGYRVLVPDYSHGKTFSTPGAGKAAYEARSPQNLAAETSAALHCLEAPGRKLIAMGWGALGGQQALDATFNESGLVAGTVLYDDPSRVTSSVIAAVKSPVLSVEFSDDPQAGPNRALADEIRRLHRPIYFHVYPGAVDRAAFLSGLDHQNDAVRLAWTETRGFVHDVARQCRRCEGYWAVRHRYYRRRVYRRRVIRRRHPIHHAVRHHVRHAPQ